MHARAVVWKWEPVSPAEQIAAWLRAAGGPLSGEAMARRLGCTRAAVAKHVAALRRAGWRIDARRAEGYRLVSVPDRLSPAEVGPHLTGAWRDVRWLAETDSTQRVARELARGGAAEGTIVVAEAQTAGRGRLGRSWHSPPGVSIYCSIVLRPPAPPTAVPQLALVAGLAAADAVVDATGLDARIKWPNDVLVEDRKVVGILTEMEAEVDRVHFVIAGIGVNVNTPPDAFPPELRDKAGSLRAALGRPVERVVVLARLVAALEARYATWRRDGLAPLLPAWAARDALAGRTVAVGDAAGTLLGRVLGVADDGALRLDVDGVERRVTAGEVTLADAYPAARGHPGGGRHSPP